jgi:hypothetical protein
VRQLKSKKPFFGDLAWRAQERGSGVDGYLRGKAPPVYKRQKPLGSLRPEEALNKGLEESAPRRARLQNHLD